MRYKEFKEKIEDWGSKHGYATEVEIGDFKTYITIRTNKTSHIIASITNEYQFIIDTNWNYAINIKNHAVGELFDILVNLAKTPPTDRKDEKRFIIPLPWLVTTDGKQQYLTNKDGYFFASRRDENLKQIWKEEWLKVIPEFYRQFAVEFDEEKEY